MLMICNCSNIYKNNRPVYTCADSLFQLPYAGLIPSETYTFRADFLGCLLEFAMIADEKGKVALRTETLNENYQYIGALYDPFDEKVPFKIDSKTVLTDPDGNILKDPEGNVQVIINGSSLYDCISFQTKLVKLTVVQTISKPNVALTDPEGNVLTDPDGNVLSEPLNT